jgi:hypothetical protein
MLLALLRVRLLGSTRGLPSCELGWTDGRGWGGGGPLVLSAHHVEVSC